MSMLELEELKIIKLVKKNKNKNKKTINHKLPKLNQSWFKLQLKLWLYP